MDEPSPTRPGFDVHSPDGRVGVVEQVRPGELVVRSGLFARTVVSVPRWGVVAVDAERSRVVVDPLVWGFARATASGEPGPRPDGRAARIRA